MTSVNYGSATPETIVGDRFGIRQGYELLLPDGSHRCFEPFEPDGVIKRLGMLMLGAWKAWPGLHEYSLIVDQRSVHIRSYSDGRLKITVDGEDVYTEKVKIKTVKWVKHREVERRHVGDEGQDWALQKLHAEALIENARFELDRHRKQLDSQTTGHGT